VLRALAALTRRLAQLESGQARLQRGQDRINGDQHLLSIRGASRLLGVRRSKDGPIYKAIRRGDLRPVKIGKRLKIKMGDLGAWLERQTP